MRRSNKCGSIRNDQIFDLHLGSGAACESVSPAFCKTPTTFIDPIPLNSSTLSNRLELEKSLIKSSNPMLFRIWKQTFPKIQCQLMPMTGVIIGVVTPKDKTKSNPFAKLKVRIFSKSVVYKIHVSLQSRA